IQRDGQHSLGGGAADTFDCTTAWTPSLTFGTHQCLLVHAECLNDPVQTPWRADLDRHVAQKNLTIAAGAEQQMSLTITNPFSTEALATVAVRTWRVQGLTPDIAAKLGTTQWDLLANAGAPPVQKLLADHGAEVQQTDPVGIVFDGLGDEGPFEPFDERTQQQLRERGGEGMGGPVLAEAVLAPASQRDVVFFSNPPHDGHDWAYVHHLVQRLDDVELGGYAVVAHPAG
ncbi:hypothetical protein, partial [Mycobacterium hubeiense]|uniref:hypothetical protein n=1 Tax=Mycobacterium hubeiense TaxID=1867256 RepID=UPI001304288D